MRRLSIIGTVIVLATAGAGVKAEDSEAAFWPSKCNRIQNEFRFGACIDAHLNNLDRRLRGLGARIRAAEFCDRFVVGVSRFGGYAAFPDTSQETTALDWDDSATPEELVQVVDPNCVGAAATGAAAEPRRWKVMLRLPH